MAVGMSIKVVDNSDKVLKATNEQIMAALEAIGLKCEGYAKKLCPVDTGRLRNSITHEARPSEKAVYIGTNVEYAVYVEMGHFQEVGRYVPAIGARLVSPYVAGKPYIKPAATQHTDEYKKIAEYYLSH